MRSPVPPAAAEAPPGIEVVAPEELDTASARLPVGFNAVASEDGFTLSARARPPGIWLLTGFSVVWNAFLVAWWHNAVIERAWVMALASLLHVAAGLVMGYLTLRGWLNRNVITVAQATLTVRGRPIPTRNPRPLHKRDIEQIFVRAESDDDDDDDDGDDARTPSSYIVTALLTDGTRVDLVRGLRTEAQGRYIEQQIERAFSVVDAPVQGELPR